MRIREFSPPGTRVQSAGAKAQGLWDTLEVFMKRLILVHGDKGGIGKSTTARALLDWSIRQERHYTAFDSDHRNPHLFRYYDAIHPVKRVDVMSQGGIDPVFNELATGDRNVLVDLPAGVGTSLERLFQEVDIGDALAELGARATLVVVISRLKDSIEVLRLTMEAFKDVPTDYVVVKNLYFGDSDKFTRYEHSKTRKDALAKGAVEINMPDLLDDVYDCMDERNLPFLKAISKDELLFATRQRVKSWMRRFDEELGKAQKFLL